jgi:3-phosphoshikimate 1-carboxyvinyltransferase
MDAFPMKGGTFQIEPDASSGSYFWGAGKFAKEPEFVEHSKKFEISVATKFLESVKVAHWPASGWQIDQKFPLGLILSGLDTSLGLEKAELRTNELLLRHGFDRSELSRKFDLGDSIMTAIVLAPFTIHPVKFTDLGRLRVQECERVVALRTELTKCGAKVIEEGDTLTVYPAKPGELHGAEIETYNDHRMAMCFAILGLKVPGIKIKNPACVKKTFPNFFQKLAAAPPHGLGATILDAKSGRKLTHEELFAD